MSPGEVREWVAGALAGAGLEGRRVCVLVPDLTRRCPMPLVFDAVHTALAGRVAGLTVIVALGTHPPLPEPRLAQLLGYGPGGAGERFPHTVIRNHEWWDPQALVTLGAIASAEMKELSEGRLTEPVPVRVNRAVAEADTTVIIGPVLPHEVVGFSGGNKYLFPGVSGPEMIDASHWLGALITSSAIIGTPGATPVRAMIDRAAAMVPSRRLALCLVTEAEGDGLHACTFGAPEEAWARAVALAEPVHVRHLDAPVPRVLSVVAGRYGELWTAAKGVYKVEPVVADGGQVVLYAPHVAELSATHGEVIRAVGYHCRDYFTGQWDRFAGMPWGVLAHSTHVRGLGTWDPAAGERCRIRVALATGIDRATTEAVGLEYVDPAGVDVDAWRGDAGALVALDAGETLYRLS